MQQGIITLLKSAITQESYDLPEGFDLAQAYPLAKEHQIATMIYDGAVRCGISKSDPTMQKLFQVYCKALMVSEAQMREVNRIYAAFEENQIDYMPLKGCIMKAFYPRQELRLMGDADILIRKEQYEKIAILMKELGFEAADESDQDYTWKSQFLSVELHKNLMPQESPDFYRYFSDGWALAHREAGTRYAMNEMDFFLFIFVHFTKHFRLAGIGCRHVVDLWLLLKNEIIKEQQLLQKELENLHLWVFYQNICKMIAVWFDGAPNDEKAEFLTQTIFNSGSWGTKESMLMWELRQSQETKARLAYILHRIFPSYQTMCNEWKPLQKYPVLLPIAWVWRLIYKLFCHRTSFADHQKNISRFSEEYITDQRRMLKEIGIDYSMTSSKEASAVQQARPVNSRNKKNKKG